jgi:hypothetical protein
VNKTTAQKPSTGQKACVAQGKKAGTEVWGRNRGVGEGWPVSVLRATTQVSAACRCKYFCPLEKILG